MGWSQVLTTCGDEHRFYKLVCSFCDVHQGNGLVKFPAAPDFFGLVRGAVHVMLDAAMSIQAALVAQDYVGPLFEKNPCFRSDFLMLLHSPYSLQISSHLGCYPPAIKHGKCNGTSPVST